MQKIVLWSMFLIITSFTFSLDTNSQDIKGNYLYQTSGAPAATMDTFIIVDGPGAGTQLSATTDETGVKVVPEDNALTMGEGHIGGIGVGEGMNCPGPLGHYHGTLKGQPDPAPDNCGWGHVAKSSDTSTSVMGISDGYTTELSIIDLIEKEPPDYDGAANAADKSAMDLSMLQDDVRDPTKTMIGAGMAHKVSDQLEKAIKDDKFIVMILNPLPSKRDAEKDLAITLKVNNGLKAKQQALMILQDAEAMAAAMGAMAMGE